MDQRIKELERRTGPDMALEKTGHSAAHEANNRSMNAAIQVCVTFCSCSAFLSVLVLVKVVHQFLQVSTVRRGRANQSELGFICKS